MPSVKENLIAAKALIDTPEKWIKGELVSNGCYCSVGAIEQTVPFAPGECAEYAAIEAALPPEFEDDTSDWNSVVAQFNDDPTTTHADIMALFDRAIAAQDGKP